MQNDNSKNYYFKNYNAKLIGRKSFLIGLVRNIAILLLMYFITIYFTEFSTLINLGLGIYVLINYTSIMMGRIRSVGISDWWFFLTLIPYVSILFWIYLLTVDKKVGKQGNIEVKKVKQSEASFVKILLYAITAIFTIILLFFLFILAVTPK